MSKYKEIRLKLFHAFRQRFVDDGAMLPWCGIIVRFILLPLETLYFLLEKQNKVYDAYADIYTIKGKKFSGLFFHHLVFGKAGTRLEIIKRNDDDIVSITEINSLFAKKEKLS